jgi:Fe2+ or Zn2+ uptake regulation protein
MSKSTNLKNIGLKATFPRLKILELFENTEVRHLTADDVYQALLNENMDIGLATVYRVLTQFEQAGLLERHHFESGKAISKSRPEDTTTIWCASTAGVSKSFSTKRSNGARKKSQRNAVSPFRNTRFTSMQNAPKQNAYTVRT